MKAFILRIGRALYKTIRLIFFLILLFTSFQLAQMEELRLMSLKGEFSTQRHRIIDHPEIDPTAAPLLAVFDHDLLAKNEESAKEARVEVKPAPLEILASIPEESSFHFLRNYQQTKPWWRPYWLIKQPQEAMKQIYEDFFYPAIPLTLSGFIYGAYGLFLAWILWGCFIGSMRLMKRSLIFALGGSSKKPANPSESDV